MKIHPSRPSLIQRVALPRSTVTSLLCSLSTMLAVAPVSSAANLVWDPSGTKSATGSAGSGAWDTSTSSWWLSGPSNTTWADSNSATFGGTDGTAQSYVISLTGGSTFTTTGIAINNTGYRFQAASAATLNLGTGTTSALSIATGKSATIGNNVTVTSSEGAGNTAIKGGGTLNIGGSGITNAAVTHTGLLIKIDGGTTVNVNSGGSLSTTAAAIVVGGSASQVGILNVEGGTVSASANNVVLANGAGATGTLNINSGSVTITGASNVVRFGSSGGTSGTGIVNLNGGTLTTSGLTQTGTTSATLNLNGGVLKATKANTGFLTGTITNVVKTGGAKIDTNSFAITIGQALIHDAGLESTVDGGLTKSGTGTLTLSTANTFTGRTLVNAGTLALSNVLALQNSALDVSGAGTVTFTAGTNTYTLGGLQGVGTLTATGKTIGLNSSGSSAVTITGSGDFQVGAAITVAATAFTFDGTLNITLSDTLSTGSHTFNLFDGQTGGSFDSVSIAGSYTASGGSGSAFTDSSGNSFSFNNSTGDLSVTISAVPEPSTYAILAGASMLGVAVCRRRKTVIS